MNEINKLEDIKVNPYQNILYMKYPITLKHPRMSNIHRAGQFSPFAALTGFDEQIKETQRLTNNKMSLDEDYLSRLNDIISFLIQARTKYMVMVTYFKKDYKKSGGTYLKKKGIFSNIDSYHKTFIFQDKEKISLSDIVKIEIIDFNSMDYLI